MITIVKVKQNGINTCNHHECVTLEISMKVGYVLDAGHSQACML